MIGLKFWKKISDVNSVHVNTDKIGEKRMLGKFEVVRELGRGSMGVVDLGRGSRQQPGCGNQNHYIIERI